VIGLYHCGGAFYPIHTPKKWMFVVEDRVQGEDKTDAECSRRTRWTAPAESSSRDRPR
jgi:hypothetical protein